MFIECTSTYRNAIQVSVHWTVSQLFNRSPNHTIHNVHILQSIISITYNILVVIILLWNI